MNIKDFVVNWNLKQPLDRWWRQKHKIAFNSEIHRRTNRVDMLFEYLEDKLYNKTVEFELMNNSRIKEFEKGQWLKNQEISSEEESKLFDKLVDNFKIKT